MEPLITLVVSAVVGLLANFGSDLLSSLIQKKKSRDIELTLADGTKKILRLDVHATPAEVEQSVRRAVGEQRSNTTSAGSDADPSR